MFDRELKFFIDNQSELVDKYDGKVLVLRGESVADVYDDAVSAYVESQKKYEPGSYMIQPCAPGPDAFTVSIASSAVI